MPQAPFDPCKQWLGIDAVDLEDPRRVLGVAQTESDPLAVIRAAGIRLSLLRGISPGPFEIARNALIKRVEEAREALLLRLAAHPTTPAINPSAVPSSPLVPACPSVPPAPPVPSFPAVPSFAAVGDQSQYQQPQYQQPQYQQPQFQQPQFQVGSPTAPEGTPPSGLGPPESQPFLAAPRKLRHRNEESSGTGVVLAALAGLGILAVALLINLLTQSDSNPNPKTNPSQNVRTVEVARKPEEKEKNRPRVPSQRPNKSPNNPAPFDADASLDTTPDTTSDRAVSTSTLPGGKPPQSPPPKAKPPAAKPLTAPVTTAVPPPNPPSKPVPLPVPVPVPVPKQPDVTMPPETEPPEAEPVAKESTEQQQNLEELLAAAFGAMGKRDRGLVEAKLTAAETLAASAQSKKRIAGWKLLDHYASGFIDYRNDSLKTIASGDEYDVGDKKIAVVEITPDVFIFRAAGKNRSVSYDKIPSPILVAIVTKWFDQKPGNNLFIAAYYLTQPEPNLEKARDYLEKAQSGGVDASQLLALLDDSVILAAGQ